jgi:inhibitor of KinA
MHITPLGDAALVVHLCAGFEDDAERCLTVVTSAQSRLEAARLPGVIEIAPAFTTLGVFFDPLRTHDLEGGIAQALRKRSPKQRTKARRIDVPVCYSDEFAPDLADVAARAALTPAEVIELHWRGLYRVACVGFTPGFPYLSGLPEAIATPRRGKPRDAVPAGSVAIGGRQTGIYPHASPGGWNIIGRTPLRLFDPGADPPSVFVIGDAVRFRSITRAEFDSFSE